MAVEFKVLLAIVCICSTSISSYAHMSISREEDLELERKLNILNKPPIKTFQTQEGDVIDCVDMYKQAAFDHPLLKNHKIQLRPSYIPTDSSKTSSKVKSVKSRQLRYRREACPTGTVPIKRTTKEELIRTRSLHELPAGHNNANANGANDGSGHTVDIRMQDDAAYGIKYYGGSARVAVYNLSLSPDQGSSANIWVQTEPLEQLNMIVAGWKVSQELHKDGLTRLYTYWTGDGYRNGCFNTLCPGFVQVDKQIFLGFSIAPTSIPDGPQYDYFFLVYQDRATGNWWLVGSDPNIAIGYWPKELFPRMGDSAQYVAWGGIANPGANGISPPMGNGNKPNGDSSHAAYFRLINWIDERNQSIYPKDDTDQHVDKSGCYDLKNDKYVIDKEWHYTFTFGGPGGYCG